MPLGPRKACSRLGLGPTPLWSLRARGAGINQKRAAAEAGVSRRQLAILENGGNISVQFLLKVARYLDLTNIPLDGSVQLVSGQGGLNVAELLRALDLLAAFVEKLRLFAMDAVLPPSEQHALTDAPAIRQFIERHAADEDGVSRLTEAIRASATESPALQFDQARARLVAANIYRDMGETEKALRIARACEVVFVDYGQPSFRAMARSCQGSILFALKRFREGLEIFTDLVEQAEREGDKLTLARALNNHAECARELGDLRDRVCATGSPASPAMWRSPGSRPSPPLMFSRCIARFAVDRFSAGAVSPLNDIEMERNL